jgi:hypothetical protein
MLVILSSCKVTALYDENDDGLNLPSQNYFTEARPDVICGKAGYQFLLRNYIGPHCGSCHANGGFADPKFGDTNDPDAAYLAALSVFENKWEETLTNNQFCGASCSLDSRGRVYNGFREWLDNSTDCP